MKFSFVFKIRKIVIENSSKVGGGEAPPNLKRVLIFQMQYPITGLTCKIFYCIQGVVTDLPCANLPISVSEMFNFPQKIWINFLVYMVCPVCFFKKLDTIPDKIH